MMSRFVARIELHGADAADYTALHQAMLAIGFRQIFALNGFRYKLPTGTYFSNGRYNDVGIALTAVRTAVISMNFPPDNPAGAANDGTSALLVVKVATGSPLGFAGLKRRRVQP
jgi:hypothetical protein